MAFTPKDFTGSIWVNDKKTADNHPDRTGSIMVAGIEYWINGWLKKTKDGKPYLSLSVKPKAGETGSKEDSAPF
jgi:uncharacterized protein (DUF736 family)